jgi:hypothetical protein
MNTAFPTIVFKDPSWRPARTIDRPLKYSTLALRILAELERADRPQLVEDVAFHVGERDDVQSVQDEIDRLERDGHVRRLGGRTVRERDGRGGDAVYTVAIGLHY